MLASFLGVLPTLNPPLCHYSFIEGFSLWVNFYMVAISWKLLKVEFLAQLLGLFVAPKYMAL
jgi:hypothetical protein